MFKLYKEYFPLSRELLVHLCQKSIRQMDHSLTAASLALFNFFQADGFANTLYFHEIPGYYILR